MKTIFILFFVVFFTSAFISYNGELPKGNYVVVGAYSINKESYAKAYVNHLNETGLSAQYGLSRTKKLYFVYLSESNDFNEAVSKMLETRKNEQFSDAWVFVNKIGPHMASEDESVEENEEQSEDETSQVSKSSNVVEVIKDQTDEEADQPVSKVIAEEVDSVSESAKMGKPKEVKEINELSQTEFKVNLYNAQTAAEVNGSVDLVDTERAKQIKKFKSGEVQVISNPENGTGRLSLIVDTFGFRKQQKEINFFNPLSDTSRVDINFTDSIYQVNFDLIRYSIGDFVVMYNVAFFKDAAVMRPKSKFEVNSLLEMMEENPEMRIRIHGHVNGKHPGKIISKGEETDYFKLSDSNKIGVGSAKELSKQRAELIRDLMVENGVRSDRMEIKAWGGKRMIHDKNSTRADENVRVEIEILED